MSDKPPAGESRIVTFDLMPQDPDYYFVLTEALGDWAARTRAEIEDGGAAESHLRWAETAEAALGRIEAALSAPSAEAPWNRLRDQITRDAATEQELGDDYSESSGDLSWDSANKHWGRAEALREVLAAMDRMEAGQ